MRVHIDKAGRIVLPKSVRRQLGLTPDTALELVQSADGVLLRRVEDRPSMRQVDGLWVHQGAAIPAAAWGRGVDDMREQPADMAGAP